MQQSAILYTPSIFLALLGMLGIFVNVKERNDTWGKFVYFGTSTYY